MTLTNNPIGSMFLGASCELSLTPMSDTYPICVAISKIDVRRDLEVSRSIKNESLH